MPSAPSLPHLVADPSGEECHELRGLKALSVPVLNGFAAQEVVQLDGQHGARHLLVPRRLLAYDRRESFPPVFCKCFCQFEGGYLPKLLVECIKSSNQGTLLYFDI